MVLLDDEPDGAVLEDDDVLPADDGLVVAELDVPPEGDVLDELPVDGPLMELEPVLEGLDELLVSVLVVDELDDDGVEGVVVVVDELDEAGGVAGVVVDDELVVPPGGVMTVLSLRSHAETPRANATATALDNKILDFMGNSFPLLLGNGDELLKPHENAAPRKNARGSCRAFRPRSVASSVPHIRARLR